jgi:hypothetical protein
MARNSSQSARWDDTRDRAMDAVLELQSLHQQWADTWTNFVDEWTAKRDQYLVALNEAIQLQENYASKDQPENLRDAKIQREIDEVASIDFHALRDVPDLKNIPNPLEDFDPEEIFGALSDARGVPAPEMYGRRRRRAR